MCARDKTPRERSEEREVVSLRPEATRSTEPRAIRREHPYEKDDFRTEFDRDYTRIIHSRAFRRLRHKTQVFISPQNDHICTRLEHSLYVASVAKTLANALGLNAELVIAVAAGHDLGHAPFGHKGEKCLDALAQVDKAVEAMFDEFKSLAEEALRSDGRELFPGRREPCVRVFGEFLTADVGNWREQRPARLALDFIAGMTDSFFISAFEELFLPRGTF